MNGSFCVLRYCEGRLTLLPDKLGLYKIYRDESGSVISSSFLGVLETVEQLRPDPQSIYEYVFQGATYDGRTLFDQVRLLERRAIFHLGSTIAACPLPDDLCDGPDWSSFDDHLARAHDALRVIFRSIVAGFGDAIDTALSGGFDSRLILALLREQRAMPRIHVYGASTDPDVRIAKTIAAGEGILIEHVDKSAATPPDADEFRDLVVRNFMRLDGYPAEGIFDNGSDVATRADRAAGGALALNGGGGEIFRNFFYLGDRTYSIRQLLWSFFSGFDPAMCSEAFDEREYLLGMAKAIARLFGKPADADCAGIRLAREEIEYLYPCLRCVYWMGRNNSVNNRFGYAATPFIATELIKLALRIPIAAKNYGRFEAALIARADPALAGYPSAHGQPPSEAPSLSRRLEAGMTMLRPPWVRRFSYRIQHRRARLRPSFVLGDGLAKVIDPSFPELRRYFKIDKVTDEFVLNRIATLEYIFENYPVRH